MQNNPKTQDKSDKKLVLIDGYGFVFRAYHSMPPLTNEKGDPIGALHGFTNMLLKLLSQQDADFMALILDSGSKTFRNDIYSEYKANRPPAPEDLVFQLPLIKEVAQSMKLPTVNLAGYEADDIIATYAKLASAEGYKTRIISSDKDLMQLVDDNVHMYDPMKSKIIDSGMVFEKFGVNPDKVLDILSLMGDSSDNIPGVAGIGPKTAAQLIEQFGSLEEILDNAHLIKQNKRRETLLASREIAMLSKELVTLCEKVPVEQTLDSLKVIDYDYDGLVDFCNEYGLKSIASKVSSKTTIKSTPKEQNNNVKISTAKNDFCLIESVSKLQEWLNSHYEIFNLTVIFDLDKNDNINGISLNIEDNKACFINFNQVKQEQLFEIENKNEITTDNVLEILAPYVADKAVIIITDEAKLLFKLFKNKVSSFDNISLMSYVLKAGLGNHKLADMASGYLQIDVKPLDKKSSNPETLSHHCFNAVLATNLHKYLKQELFNHKMLVVYNRIEKPLIKIIANMEQAGIKVSPDVLKLMSDDFAKRLISLEEKIKLIADVEFNVASPKQLGEVLFDKLGLPHGKQSKKTGAYSTDANVLEKLSVDEFEIADVILEYRQISKLKSTYTDSLSSHIKEDGRIHTNFAMQSTSTGRLSSLNPNLQNIPIRSPEGNKIRQAFIAKEGCKLLAADYSQIELRLLADMADIAILKEAFNKGQDIHSATASQMFGVAIDQVDKELRRKAKMINFGIIYGISAFGLAKRLGIGRTKASDYIKKYFQQYPGIQDYMTQAIDFAKENGFVLTKLGRKCHLKDINSKNPTLKNFSERAAINAPLQGTAADIIKKAMINLSDELAKNNSTAQMLLQIHDELILEDVADKQEITADLLKKVMENAYHLSVPLIVDVNIGDNWSVI